MRWGDIIQYRQLGKTNLVVSEMGLGTAQIGGPSLIKGKPFGAKPISDEDVYKILSLAYEAGINFFDSSDKYGDGLAEKRLGEFFNGSKDVILATKCGIDSNHNRRFDRQYIMDTIEGSLCRLKREQIDLFQFSKPTLSNIENDDLIETVLLLKEQGKIAYAGISVGSIEDGRGFLQQDVWDSFQIIYNLLTLDFKSFISDCFNAGKGVIIRSPLSSGMLTGRFDENTKFHEFDDRSAFMQGELLRIRSQMVNKIKERFCLTNEGLIDLSLNFLLSDPEVTSIIPGATSPMQMQTNLKALTKMRLSEDHWREVFDFCHELSMINY